MAGRGKGGGGLGKRVSDQDRYAEDPDFEIIEAKRYKAEQRAEWELRNIERAEASRQKDILEAAQIKAENEKQEKQEAERKAAYDKYKADAKAKQDMEYASQIAIEAKRKTRLQEIAKKQTTKPLLFIFNVEDGGTVFTVVADHPAFDQFTGFVSRKDFVMLFDGYAQIAESMGIEVTSNKSDMMVEFCDAFSAPAFGAETRGTVMLIGPGSEDSDSDSDYDE
jgi:hypothetical protein